MVSMLSLCRVQGFSKGEICGTKWRFIVSMLSLCRVQGFSKGEICGIKCFNQSPVEIEHLSQCHVVQASAVRTRNEK